MNRTVPNINNNFQRCLFVFATVFLILFSSCAIKASVRNLVGIPSKTEQSNSKTHQNFTANYVEKCAEIENADTLIVQKVSFDANDLLPVVLYIATFLFLFRFRSESKESKHPVYSGSSKIRSSIPIFLEYRKLIIHYAS